MKEFKKGQKIEMRSGVNAEVIEILGRGGQGIVYKVDYCGHLAALKWYFPNKLKNPDKFYSNLERNIRNKTPAPEFLWPVELSERYQGSFGYLMELRPPEYKEFSQFLMAKAHYKNFECAIYAALSIVNAFRELHNRGYSYQDLNDGNFFINPDTGAVLICDNDNVAPYGESLGIAGKCRYMAPEVVMGLKRPDIHTDRYSLAVILYMVLLLNHPLEGKATMCPCLTEELEQKFYGKAPVFVWDKQTDTNRPVRGVHINEINLWPVYPRFVQEAFERSFSRELMIGRDREHRVMEKEWMEIFISLRDCMVHCGCREETFVKCGEQQNQCIHCQRNLPVYPVLKVKKYQIALEPSKKIYACHVIHDSDDYKQIMGEVITSKSRPVMLGLKNGSGHSWTAILPDNSSKVYGDGEVIRIVKGLKIDFGNGNVGEIY